MDLKLETIPKVVLSCFALHNFCELHNDTIDEELVRSQVARNRSMETEYQNVPDPVYSCTTGEGEAIRDVMTQYIQYIHICKTCYGRSDKLGNALSER
jgi:hypothetical protein